MDRRTQLQSSEASGYSLADSIKSLALNAQNMTAWTFMSDEDIRKANSHTILSRMLSTRTHISITSTLARENDEASRSVELRKYVHIGQGQCGTVLAFQGTDEVVKIPNGPHKQHVLYQDAQIHAAVEKAFREAPTELRAEISIPRYCTWVTPAMSQWWNSRLNLFPSEYQSPTYGLVSQRIFPLPAPVRSAIIDTFCPKQLRKSVQQDPSNRDCLVRLYLGKREPGKRAQEKSFRLRNFPLMVNDLEELKIEALGFARVMADALAILHWSAKVDGNDIEFVLGSASTETLYRTAVGPEELKYITKDSPAHNRADFDFTKRHIHVWLLDFNQCVTFDEENDPDWLQLLTRAFWFNDPYYPRPVSDHPADTALWESFAERYLYASQHLTNSAGPARFIQKIEEEGKERRTMISKQGKDSLLGALMEGCKEMQIGIKTGFISNALPHQR